MTPVFATAAAKLDPEMRLVKVDTEREQGPAARYAIRSIPTLMLLKGGKELARTAGSMSEPALMQWAREVASSL